MRATFDQAALMVMAYGAQVDTSGSVQNTHTPLHLLKGQMKPGEPLSGLT